jgi:hypothetical protein
MATAANKRSDRTTLLKRSEEVLAMRLNGAEFADIKQHAEEQGWGVSGRSLQRYIVYGDKQLAKTLEKDRERLINRHIAQRRALYQKALAEKDHATALRVLQDEASLLGLYPKNGRVGIHEGGSLTLNVIEQVIVAQHPQAALPAPVTVEAITHESNGNGTGQAGDSQAAPRTAGVSDQPGTV